VSAATPRLRAAAFAEDKRRDRGCGCEQELHELSSAETSTLLSKLEFSIRFG
jgi:hypothetical protein